MSRCPQRCQPHGVCPRLRPAVRVGPRRRAKGTRSAAARQSALEELARGLPPLDPARDEALREYVTSR